MAGPSARGSKTEANSKKTSRFILSKGHPLGMRHEVLQVWSFDVVEPFGQQVALAYHSRDIPNHFKILD